MFFGNEEDSLAQVLRNPRLINKPSSTKRLSREEELDIQRTKDLVKQLEEEELLANTKRAIDPEHSSLHFSNTDTAFRRKKQIEKKNEVDDVLDLLNDIESNDKKSKTMNNFAPKGEHQKKPSEEKHNFFEDLELEADLDLASNKATFNKTATDKMTKTNQSFQTQGNEDLKSRRANLFGLNKEASGRNSENNSNNQSFSKPTGTDLIGTIDLGVSRRKNQRNLSSHMNKDGRPMTSPLERGSPTNDRLPDTSKLDFFEQNMMPAPAKQHLSHLNLEEDNEDHIGEYIPSMGSNKGVQKPPLIKKAPPSSIQTGVQLSPNLSQKNFERTDIDKMSIDNFDGRSKMNDITANEENAMNTTGIIPRKRTEDSRQIAKPMSNVNAIFNNYNQQRENVVDNTKIGAGNLGLGNIGLGVGNFGMKGEIEDLRSHIDTLKANYEEQIRVLRMNHAEELDFERKSRTRYLEDFEKQRERELERMKENFESEIQRKDELHKFENDQLRRKYELEIESLRREIDQQVKVASLTTEIQKHNDRLYDIAEKMDVRRNQEEYNKSGEVYKREQILAEKERSIQKSMESLENEKKRLDFMRQEVDNEKALLRKEYKRLDELQNSIKTLESEKLKETQLEKKRLEKEREALERERREFKEMMDMKAKENDRLSAVFETEKAEIFKQQERFQENFRVKVKELEESRVKFTQHEADLVKRRALVEKKEMELAKISDDLKTKQERLRMEQHEFEKEAKRVYEISIEVQKESEFLNSFKRNFDLEKEKLRRKQLELDSYVTALNQEKGSLNREKYDLELKAKTIDNLRFEVVKSLEENPEIIKKMNIVTSQEVPKREFLKKLTKENQRDVWNVIRKDQTETRPKSAVKSGFENKQSFNSDHFMSYLRKFDQEHAENQFFLSVEKQQIIGKSK